MMISARRVATATSTAARVFITTSSCRTGFSPSCRVDERTQEVAKASISVSEGDPASLQTLEYKYLPSAHELALGGFDWVLYCRSKVRSSHSVGAIPQQI